MGRASVKIRYSSAGLSTLRIFYALRAFLPKKSYNKIWNFVNDLPSDCEYKHRERLAGGETVRHDTENLLIWRINHWNDRKAANDLVEKYYREIYAFTYRQTLEKQLAMDLTQEIFISALQSLGGYEAEKGSFRTWLYRIASRRVADYFRSRCYRFGKLTQPMDDGLPPRDDLIFDRLEEKESARLVLEQIGTFDGVTQQILRLRLFSEQTFPQIAQTVCLPEGTAKSRYYAAVRKIRGELEGLV